MKNDKKSNAETVRLQFIELLKKEHNLFIRLAISVLIYNSNYISYYYHNLHDIHWKWLLSG